MGHISNLKNLFKSINTFAQSYWYYHNIDLDREKTSIEWSLFVKPWVPFTQGCFVPSLVEIDPMVMEKIF